MRAQYAIFICMILAMGVASHGVGAEDSTNTPSARAVSPESLRDPFWPVGFRPIPKSEEERDAQADRIQELTRWPKLILRGITRTGQNEYIAILEGVGLVEGGDIISMRKDGLIYRWRINEISEKGISRTRLDVREPASAPPGSESRIELE